MKTRIVILTVVAALLLAGSVALAHPADRASSPLYVVEPAGVSGGTYRLAGGRWYVSCPAGGGGYRLQGPVRPDQGAACCCAYLPSTFRSWP